MVRVAPCRVIGDHICFRTAAGARRPTSTCWSRSTGFEHRRRRAERNSRAAARRCPRSRRGCHGSRGRVATRRPGARPRRCRGASRLLVPASAPALWTPQGLHLLRRSRGLRRGRRARARAGGPAVRLRCSAPRRRSGGDLRGVLAPESAERLRVIPNGVAVARAADPAEVAVARRELGLDDGTCAVLFLGAARGAQGPAHGGARGALARASGARTSSCSWPAAARSRRELAARGGRRCACSASATTPPACSRPPTSSCCPRRREGQSFALLEAMSPRRCRP